MSEVDIENQLKKLLQSIFGFATRISDVATRHLVLGSLTLIFLNIVGFIVVSFHFVPRGVPIDEISFGARTIWTAIVTFLFPGLFCLLAAFVLFGGLSIEKILSDITGTFSSKAKKAIEEESESKDVKPRRLTFNVLLAFFSVVPPLFMAEVALALPHLFFDGLQYDIKDSAPVFRRIFLLTVGILVLIIYGSSKLGEHWRSKRKKESVDSQQATAVRSLEDYSIYSMCVALLFLWCLSFPFSLYPLMRPEFGGGKPRLVTMYFTEERLAQMNLADTPPSIPNSPLARRVRIIFETEQEYRISAATETDPLVIYKISKQDVTLVAYSPTEKAP